MPLFLTVVHTTIIEIGNFCVMKDENVEYVVSQCCFLFLILGFLTGGHVMRLCHGHDESLTIPEADKSEQEHR